VFHRVLIGFDGSPESSAALRLAVLLADPEATLIVGHVATHDGDEADAVLRDARLETARALLGDRAGVEYVMPEGPEVAGELHRVARETACDLIAVGSSRRRGAGRVLLGSNTEDTLHGAPCAVAVGVPDGPDRLRRVGVAFDGTAAGRQTVGGAGALARELGAALTVLAVVDTRHTQRTFGPEGGLGDVRERASRLLAAVAAEQSDAGVEQVHRQLHRGDPVHEALGLGRESDLLVVGSRADGAALRVLLGSVSSKVVRRATAPVLVLPAGARVPTEPAAA
jgi:nucleotide-binding universal stress UspA family protein